jgi:hypothetical protein
MPVDRRIASRFVNAGQEPRVQSSNLSVDRSGCGWVPATADTPAASVVNSLCRKLRHLCPSVCPRRPWFLLARTPVHFRREDIAPCCRSQHLEALSATSAFILAGSRCSRHDGADGHAISATHPDPGTIVNRKPCNFTIAVTRSRPRPRPDMCLTLSDR